MRWCCFLFWFIYRLTLACLAHFNWIVALYVNCAYFVAWKSYDLLWFWMHLTLCSCFKPLRSENYLVVWCNLLYKRRTKYPNRTYKEIYMLEYGKRKNTKAERELERMNTMEAKERNKSEHSSSSDDDEAVLTNKQDGDSFEFRPNQRTKFDLNEGGEMDGEDVDSRVNDKYYSGKVSPKEVMAEEERECMEQVFVGCAVRSYPDLEKHSMQTLDTNGEHVRPVYARKYCAAEESSNRTNDVEVVLSNQPRTWLPRINASESPRTRLRNVDGIGPRTEMVNGDNLNNTDTVSVHSGSTWSERIQRLIPKVFTKNPRCDEVLYIGPLDVLRPDFTNPYDLKSKKQIAKREKRDRKALTKRLRARRRAELAVIAKREARERTISSAIELLLQLLRMMTSFAILVGNIRKTFIPAQFKWLKPGQNAFDNPGLLMLFRCTVFLDVLLFWTNVIWAYCLQWHLCCRLGLIRFWLWTLILITVGGIVMLIPMSYVQNDLDISWCRFVPNSSLAKYQPNW